MKRARVAVDTPVSPPSRVAIAPPAPRGLEWVALAAAGLLVVVLGLQTLVSIDEAG